MNYILATAEQAANLADGSVTVVRRAVWPQPKNLHIMAPQIMSDGTVGWATEECPFSTQQTVNPIGNVGEVVGVKEPWRSSQVDGKVWYAGVCGDTSHKRWQPAHTMPGRAVRTRLRIKSLRLESVDEWSLDSFEKEMGFYPNMATDTPDEVEAMYARYWNSIPSPNPTLIDGNPTYGEVEGLRFEQNPWTVVAGVEVEET